MKEKFVLITGLIFIAGFESIAAHAQSSFNGIIPMITTKTEVEKKFGLRDRYGRYEFEEGMVRLHYREAECDKSDTNCNCFVPVGTVLEVSVWPSSDIRIEDLKLDPKEWESREEDDHVPGIIYYFNKKTGVAYYAQEGVISVITYGASEETCKKLTLKQKQKANK